MPALPNFDFSSELDRRDGDSLKWNKYAGRDVLPLWVADMDFVAPPAVIVALERRIAHGCLGYPVASKALVDTVLAHLQREYAWTVEPSSLIWLPGVVTGLNLACRAIDGDVLTATPVYPPFLSAPGLAGRHLARVALRLEDGAWRLDLAAMEAALTPQTRLFLLCHPHNPVGRVWRREELVEIAAFCRRHDLVVCSDEIHCGLILDAQLTHTPLAMIDGETASRCITLMAPSKTYNVPGLACAFAVIQDAALRARFTAQMRGIVADVNVLGYVAAQAAYGECDDWHGALIETLRANRDLVEKAVAEIPGLSMTHIEATYLAWIDARGLKVADPAAFFEAGGVGLSRGDDFGLPGWVRLNFGCPRPTLERALERMAAAVAGARRGGQA